MNAEEELQIETLFDPESSSAEKEFAITWLSNYLEEGDILNLPVSTRSLEALEKFTSSAPADASLKARAKKVIGQYKR